MTAESADKSGSTPPCSQEALAALLQAGLPPEQAVRDWCQTISAAASDAQPGSEPDTDADPTPDMCPDTHADSRPARLRALGAQSGLAQLFAAALLQANPKAAALLDGAQDVCAQGDMIAKAYAELAALTKTAAQAQKELAVAQATLAGERRRIAMAEALARDRETIMGAAVLSLSAAQAESDAPTGPTE